MLQDVVWFVAGFSCSVTCKLHQFNATMLVGFTSLRDVSVVN